MSASPPADSRFRHGLALLYGRKFLRARRVLAKAAGADTPAAVWAAQELTQTFLRRGEGEAGIAFVRATLEPPLRHHALGYLLRRMGRNPEAERELRRAWNSRPRVWAAGNELGHLLTRRDRTRDGLAMLRRTASHFRRSGDAWGQSSSLFYLGFEDLRRFRLHDARRRFEASRALKKQVGDRHGLAGTLLNLGLSGYYLARYAEALDSFAAALSVFTELSDAGQLGVAHNSIGLCRLEVGDFPQAAASFSAALRYLERTGVVATIGPTRTNILFALRQSGSLRGIARHLQRALWELGRVADPDFVAVGIANLAEAITAAGDPERALALLDAETGPVEKRTAVLRETERSRALMALHRYSSAVTAATRAVEGLPRTGVGGRGLVAARLPAELLLGRALLASGQRRRAEAIIGRAVREVDEVLLAQPGVMIRIGLLEATRAVHDALISLTLDSGSEPRIREAWTVVSDLKARELRAALRGRAPHHRRRPEFEQNAAEIRSLMLAGDLDRSELQRLNVLRDLSRKSGYRGGRGQTREPGPAPPVGRGVLLVEYHLADDRAFVFARFGRSETVIRLPTDRARITRSIDRLLAPLFAAGVAADPAAQLNAFDHELCARLGQQLLGGVLRFAPTAEHLVIVADGALRALPFAMLPDPRDAARRIADGPLVSYVPAGGLLRARRGAGAGRRVVVFGFSPATPVVIRTSGGALELGPLPAAEQEARAVAALYPGARMCLGRDATPARLSREIVKADVVHVAAHAISDANAPDLSGILLANSNNAGTELLSASAVADLKLGPGTLVILSACDTGRGQLRHREGVLGLTRAFLAAGAEAVLATLWPVVDDVAFDTLVDFHRRLCAGADRHVALRESVRAIRSRRAHPFFWAPFVLVDRDARRGRDGIAERH